ncbi:hypothetical protein SAMN05216554_3538 [Herbiconiux ginsengi]|uniref:Uncharacterized protein n=1 Tax=Herbiconiux ginsengi TaxID=381665 RepID=A0A1H3SPJ7_9MICO|nr:hypothetical protein SAMN05216554_3538 [Herbiconiux ginsengi]
MLRGGARAQLAELEAFVADLPAIPAGSLLRQLASSPARQLASAIEARWLAYTGRLDAARRLAVPLIATATAYPRVLVPSLFIAGRAHRAEGDTAIDTTLADLIRNSRDRTGKRWTVQAPSVVSRRMGIRSVMRSVNKTSQHPPLGLDGHPEVTGLLARAVVRYRPGGRDRSRWKARLKA